MVSKPQEQEILNKILHRVTEVSGTASTLYFTGALFCNNAQIILFVWHLSKKGYKVLEKILVSLASCVELKSNSTQLFQRNIYGRHAPFGPK